MTAELTERDWEIRLFIYRFIVEHGRAPGVDETAARFRISCDDARTSYHRLHGPHQIVLDDGTDTIRMAIPLSAIPTKHLVRIDGTCIYANCAWDSLGVAAMLHADAGIDAPVEGIDESISYAIEDGLLNAPDDLSIRFPVPLKKWFDDIVDT